MILYTVMPLETVLEGLEPEGQRTFREVSVGGVRLIVEEMSSGSGRVVRLLSTDPKDFLDPRYQPDSCVGLPPMGRC